MNPQQLSRGFFAFGDFPSGGDVSVVDGPRIGFVFATRVLVAPSVEFSVSFGVLPAKIDEELMLSAYDCSPLTSFPAGAAEVQLSLEDLLHSLFRMTQMQRNRWPT